jgi:hypothetical protein
VAVAFPPSINWEGIFSKNKKTKTQKGKKKQTDETNQRNRWKNKMKTTYSFTLA